ncbi:MAG: hypothetical protein ACRDOO_01385 [Actinomadura sp.]
MTAPTGNTPKGRMRHHLDTLAAAKDATPEQRREILESVHRRAQDSRVTRPVPRRLASSTSRRALALLAAAPFAAGAVSAYMAPDSAGTALVQATGAAGLLAGLFLLRRATRELTETSGADLDERELQERDRALGAAYVTLLVCLAIVVLLAIADGPLLDIASWEPLAFGTLGTAALLPSAAAAWKWPELDEET